MLHKHQASDIKKLFNSSGQDYRRLNMKERLATLTEDEALKLLAANGKLIKRPFVLGDGIGVLGFREENWQELFL